jgi:hypothetical protein
MDGALAPVSGLKCAVCAGPLEMPASSQGACQKPGSGPVYSLTLDGPIESRYQYFTRQ